MSDKPDHLRPVPDLPKDEEPLPLVREDGVTQRAPGPLPSGRDQPTFAETRPPMPTEESGIPAEIRPIDPPDAEEASVQNHPSNLPKPPTE